DDVRERRLAKPGRTAQQDVLDRVAAAASRLEEDAQVLAHLLLADILAQEPRPERQVVLIVVRAGVQDPVGRHLRPRDLNAAASASCVVGDDFQSTDSMPERASWVE